MTEKRDRKEVEQQLASAPMGLKSQLTLLPKLAALIRELEEQLRQRRLSLAASFLSGPACDVACWHV